MLKLAKAFDSVGMYYDKGNFADTYKSLSDRDVPNKDIIRLSAIAYCESGFKQTAYNGDNSNGTSDGGIFQINSIHKLSNRFDKDSNISKALELYNKNGTNDWNSSKDCWSKVLKYM